MSLKINCPECGQEMRVAEGLDGTVRCPNCAAVLRVAGGRIVEHAPAAPPPLPVVVLEDDVSAVAAPHDADALRAASSSNLLVTIAAVLAALCALAVAAVVIHWVVDSSKDRRNADAPDLVSPPPTQGPDNDVSSDGGKGEQPAQDRDKISPRDTPGTQPLPQAGNSDVLGWGELSAIDVKLLDLHQKREKEIADVRERYKGNELKQEEEVDKVRKRYGEGIERECRVIVGCIAQLCCVVDSVASGLRESRVNLKDQGKKYLVDLEGRGWGLGIPAHISEEQATQLNPNDALTIRGKISSASLESHYGRPTVKFEIVEIQIRWPDESLDRAPIAKPSKPPGQILLDAEAASKGKRFADATRLLEQALAEGVKSDDLKKGLGAIYLEWARHELASEPAKEHVEAAWLAAYRAERSGVSSAELDALTHQIVEKWKQELPDLVTLRPVFESDFTETNPGNMPEGWKRVAGAAGILKLNDVPYPYLGFQQSGQHSVETPPIAFPVEFELNVDFGVQGNGEHAMRMTLLAGEGRGIVFRCQRNYGENWSIQLEDAEAKAVSLAEPKFRLVRQRDTFYLLAGDQMHFSLELPGRGPFTGVRLDLSETAREVWLSKLRVRHHSNANPPLPFEGLDIRMGDYIGRVPKQLDTPFTVRRVSDNSAWISPDKAGTYAVPTREIPIPSDFKLEFVARLGERGKFKMVLQGAGASTDVNLGIDRQWNRWTVSFTGADPQEIRLGENVDDVRVRLEKNGGTISVYLAPAPMRFDRDKSAPLFAPPVFADHRFQRVVFYVQGGTDREGAGSALGEIRLATNNANPARDTVRTKFDNQVPETRRPHQEAPQPQGARKADENAAGPLTRKELKEAEAAALALVEQNRAGVAKQQLRKLQGSPVVIDCNFNKANSDPKGRWISIQSGRSDKLLLVFDVELYGRGDLRAYVPVSAQKLRGLKAADLRDGVALNVFGKIKYAGLDVDERIVFTIDVEKVELASKAQ